MDTQIPSECGCERFRYRFAEGLVCLRLDGEDERTMIIASVDGKVAIARLAGEVIETQLGLERPSIRLVADYIDLNKCT